MALVFAMLLGADSIDDCDVLRVKAAIEAQPLRTLQQTLTPDLGEHPGLLPFLKTPMRRTRGADPCRVQRVPLHPSPKHQQDRVHRITVGHPRRMTAQRVKRRCWKQRLDPLPQPVRHPPTIILTDHVAHHRPPDRMA